jgi:hypothetical protein
MEATVREQLMSFTCGLDFGVITVWWWSYIDQIMCYPHAIVFCC